MGNSDFAILGIALGLGLLAGLQRERLHSRVAGIRTFALITLFGSISGMIGRHFDSDWVVAHAAKKLAMGRTTLVEAGALRLPRTACLGDRLARLVVELEGWIERFAPDEVALVPGVTDGGAAVWWQGRF